MNESLRHELQRMAGEVSELPVVYVATTDELEGLPQPQNCNGWTLTQPNAAIIERIPFYQTPGPVVVLNLASIAEHPGDYASNVRKIFLHEIAHQLPRQQFESLPDLPEFVEWDTERLAIVCKEQDESSRYTPDDPFHDAAFIRRCCHLFVRAEALGYEVTPHGMFYRLGLGDESYWIAAVAGEAIRHFGTTFSDIEQIPVPHNFVRLHERAQQLGALA